MIERTIQVQPDPEELGREFAAMNSDDQVRFLVEVSQAMDAPEYSGAMQRAYIAKSFVEAYDRATSDAEKEIIAGAKWVVTDLARAMEA